MMLPEYWLSRSAYRQERSTRAAFDRLLAGACSDGAGSVIDDDARFHEYATAMQTGGPWPDD